MLYINHHSIRRGKYSKANNKEKCSEVGDIFKQLMVYISLNHIYTNSRIIWEDLYDIKS